MKIKAFDSVGFMNFARCSRYLCSMAGEAVSAEVSAYICKSSIYLLRCVTCLSSFIALLLK